MVPFRCFYYVPCPVFAMSCLPGVFFVDDPVHDFFMQRSLWLASKLVCSFKSFLKMWLLRFVTSFSGYVTPFIILLYRLSKHFILTRMFFPKGIEGVIFVLETQFPSAYTRGWSDWNQSPDSYQYCVLMYCFSLLCTMRSNECLFCNAMNASGFYIWPKFVLSSILDLLVIRIVSFIWFTIRSRWISSPLIVVRVPVSPHSITFFFGFSFHSTGGQFVHGYTAIFHQRIQSHAARLVVYPVNSIVTSAESRGPR